MNFSTMFSHTLKMFPVGIIPFTCSPRAPSAPPLETAEVFPYGQDILAEVEKAFVENVVFSHLGTLPPIPHLSIARFQLW